MRRQNHKGLRGLSIAELLISLAIVAMLLVAVAAAFTASASAVEHNDEFFRATQAARVSMNQILTEIRRSDSIVFVTPISLSLVTGDGESRTYQYSSTDQRLQLITNDITTDPDYTLASNVATCNIISDSETPDGGGTPYVVRVSVTIIVRVGENQVRLTGSAAPRRVQTYN